MAELARRRHDRVRGAVRLDDTCIADDRLHILGLGCSELSATGADFASALLFLLSTAIEAIEATRLPARNPGAQH